MLKKLFTAVIYDYYPKVRMFSLGGLFSLVKCFWVGQGAYPRVEYLKSTSLGDALALLANIILGWKGLPGTSTIAYYKHL
jgi:hypothetical protein